MKKALLVVLLVALMAGAGVALYHFRPSAGDNPGRLPAVEARVRDLTDECEALREWYFKYNEKVEDLAENVAGWEEKLNAATSSSGDATEKLRRVSGKLSALRSTLTSIDKRLKKGISDNRGEIQTGLSKMRGEIEALAGKASLEVKSLSEQLKSSLASLEETKRNVARVTDSVTDVKRQSDSLASRFSEVEDLRKTTTSQAAEIEALKKELRGIRSRLEALKKTP